jgi:ribonuclease HI
MHVRIHTDGGSRGNPGPAGIGYVIEVLDHEGWKEIAAEGKTIGDTTNNVAEYKALIAALDMALQLGADDVDCYADSKLIVEQVKGVYKVKQPHLQELCAQVNQRKVKFRRVAFTYIPREKNKRADALVNQALDAVA